MQFVYYPVEMKTIMKTILLLVILTFMGCLPDTSGIDPPGDKLIFPVGLEVTKNGNYLIVVNSNFDLEYNAGTLVALDLNKLDKRLPSNPNGDTKYDESVCDELSADGKYCYIEESAFIKESNTIRLGAYASDLELTPDKNRALIPVRGSRAITIIDINENSGKVLSCGEGKNLRCDREHKIKSNAHVSLPIEPYEVTTKNYVDPASGETLTLGFATHLANGEVSLFLISRGKNGDKLDAKLLRVVGGVVPGASGIVASPTTNDIYVTGRRDPSPHVSVMRVATDGENGSYVSNPWFGQWNHINIQKELFAGTDARGIAVTKAGDLGFMTTRTPDALLKLDLKNYKLIDMITVGTDPSVVKIYEGTDNDHPYAFVLSFLTGQVFIVDTELMQTEVRVTGSGPQAISFDEKRKRAYIANFRESTITVLDLSGKAPFDHLRVNGRIIKIGKPRLPKGQN